MMPIFDAEISFGISKTVTTDTISPYMKDSGKGYLCYSI